MPNNVNGTLDGCRVHRCIGARVQMQCVQKMASGGRWEWPFATLSSMGAHRYEDLEIYQLANELKDKGYELIDTTPAKRDFTFRDQLRGSLSSATANVAEGFGYYDHGLFAKHVRIALASEMETLSHLDDGIERRHWSAAAVSPLQRLAKRAIRAATSFLRHLETTDAPHKWEKRKRRGGRR